jgi:hypothetical protein
MKKIKLLLLLPTLLAVVALNSCREVDPGGTAVQEMCGEWIAYSPDFHADFVLRTSNTAANDPDTIILTDCPATGYPASWTSYPGLWGFTVKAKVDYKAKTFSCTEVTNDFYILPSTGIINPYDIKISIKNGKITPKAVQCPSGVMADKIEFEILFEDVKDAGAPADYFLEIVGYRTTGFLEDEDFVYEGD